MLIYTIYTVVILILQYMLLLVINFIKVILINMHLQSICENIVNCVDIQYKNSKNKKKINY